MTHDASGLADRLTASYASTHVDAAQSAWLSFASDADSDAHPVAVLEFARLHHHTDAKTHYDSYVDAVASAAEAAGGEIHTVNDTLMPGLETLKGFDGGVSWLASFPSTRAYLDALVDPRVLDAARAAIGSVAEAYVLIGPNTVPEAVRHLPPNEPASAFPTDRVKDKAPAAIVDELLLHYPDGGADPTRATLEAMTAYDGFVDQRVHFINLYQFGDGDSDSSAMLYEYNAKAGPLAVAHGARPKAAVNVRHQLAGRVRWSRFIVLSWPSLRVFTDLRLDPVYIEEQKKRVVSADAYGNLITVARTDRNGNTR